MKKVLMLATFMITGSLLAQTTGLGSNTLNNTTNDSQFSSALGPGRTINDASDDTTTLTPSLNRSTTLEPPSTGTFQDQQRMEEKEERIRGINMGGSLGGGSPTDVNTNINSPTGTGAGAPGAGTGTRPINNQ